MKKNNRILKCVIIVTILLISLCYVTSISNVPNSIILFQGEKLDFSNILGLKLNQSNISDYKTAQVSSNLNGAIDTADLGKIDMKLSLFGHIPIKDVTLNIIPAAKVIPAGNNIGIKLYTSGVLVVGMSEISGIDEKAHKPYETTGIKEGDLIIAVNNTIIANTGELIDTVNKSGGSNINLKYTRDGDVFETNILPVKGVDNQYKMGFWVRDGSARSWYSIFL